MDDMDAFTQAAGFANAGEMHQLVSSVKLNTPNRREAFERWKQEDGTKAGLLKLLGIPFATNPARDMLHALIAAATAHIGGDDTGLLVDALGSAVLFVAPVPGETNLNTIGARVEMFQIRLSDFLWMVNHVEAMGTHNVFQLPDVLLVDGSMPLPYSRAEELRQWVALRRPQGHLAINRLDIENLLIHFIERERLPRGRYLVIVDTNTPN